MSPQIQNYPKIGGSRGLIRTFSALSKWLVFYAPQNQGFCGVYLLIIKPAPECAGIERLAERHELIVGVVPVRIPYSYARNETF